MSGTTIPPTATFREKYIFLVAAEESGDRLGAALMHALQERTDGGVRFSGVGGHEMSRHGLVSLFPIEELAILGFSAIPRRLPMILRRLRETANTIIATRPDALVIIDSPDFTHRVARRVRAADPSIPIVNYVSPSVWAWRPGRARAMRHYIDHVLALFPFEPGVHQSLHGPPCTYVGHPLADKIGNLRPNAEEARRRLADPPVILVLPGSRGSEIRRLLTIFADAISRVHSAVGPLDIVLPTVPHLRDQVMATIASWPQPPRVVVDQAEKEAAFRVARAALAKSGTVTLELALAGVPTVAAYRVSAVEAVVGRLMIHAPSAILSNLVIGENVVPEFLQGNCTAERLAATLIPLLSDSHERRRQLEAFARLDAIMEIGRRTPAASAADIVLAMLHRPEKAFAGRALNL
jgi:lipid-A-disaccharide synthase